MNQPQPLRFTLDIRTHTVTDTQTNEVHEFATSDAAWFGRARLEVASRPAPKPSTKEQKRQEKRQAGAR